MLESACLFGVPAKDCVLLSGSSGQESKLFFLLVSEA